MTAPTDDDLDTRWRKLAAEIEKAGPIVGQGELFDTETQGDLFAEVAS